MDNQYNSQPSTSPHLESSIPTPPLQPSTSSTIAPRGSLYQFLHLPIITTLPTSSKILVFSATLPARDVVTSLFHHNVNYGLVILSDASHISTTNDENSGQIDTIRQDSLYFAQNINHFIYSRNIDYAIKTILLTPPQHPAHQLTIVSTGDYIRIVSKLVIYKWMNLLFYHTLFPVLSLLHSRSDDADPTKPNDSTEARNILDQSSPSPQSPSHHPSITPCNCYYALLNSFITLSYQPTQRTHLASIFLSYISPESPFYHMALSLHRFFSSPDYHHHLTTAENFEIDAMQFPISGWSHFLALRPSFYPAQSPPQISTLESRATLHDAVALMTNNNIHRLFIADENLTSSSQINANPLPTSGTHNSDLFRLDSKQSTSQTPQQTSTPNITGVINHDTIIVRFLAEIHSLYHSIPNSSLSQHVSSSSSSHIAESSHVGADPKLYGHNPQHSHHSSQQQSVQLYNMNGTMRLPRCPLCVPLSCYKANLQTPQDIFDIASYTAMMNIVSFENIVNSCEIHSNIENHVIKNNINHSQIDRIEHFSQIPILPPQPIPQHHFRHHSSEGRSIHHSMPLTLCVCSHMTLADVFLIFVTHMAKSVAVFVAPEHLSILTPITPQEPQSNANTQNKNSPTCNFTTPTPKDLCKYFIPLSQPLAHVCPLCPSPAVPLNPQTHLHPSIFVGSLTYSHVQQFLSVNLNPYTPLLNIIKSLNLFPIPRNRGIVAPSVSPVNGDGTNDEKHHHSSPINSYFPQNSTLSPLLTLQDSSLHDYFEVIYIQQLHEVHVLNSDTNVIYTFPILDVFQSLLPKA